MVAMRKKRKLSSSCTSFLKVLDGDFSNQLMIPEAFIKNINGDIPNWFLLEIAGTRRGWRVDTKQDENGGFYFDYGWSDFKEEQSLHVGDSLLFEFEEPLLLQVKIFKKDSTEKRTGSYLESECEIQDSDCRKPSPKSPLLSEPDFFSTRPTTQLKGHKKSQGSSDWIEMETDYGEKQCEVNDTTGFETDIQCRERPKYSDRGKVFVTKKSGVRYILTWRNVPHLYYYLTFPRAIITRKMLSDDETVILKDHEGNSWRMKLRARPGGRVDLVQGWKEFLIENDVSNGDVLIFEFVSNNVIQIHIERAKSVSERGCQIDRPSESANKREPIVSDYTCEEPAVNDTVPSHSVSEIEGKTERVFFDDFTTSSFSVTWRQWNTTQACYLHIPKDIAIERKLKNEDIVVLYDPDGIEWPVEIKLEPDGRLGLALGWIEFWGQHKISYGDTLTFKFVSDHEMKVNITRALPSYTYLNVGWAVKQEVLQPE